MAYGTAAPTGLRPSRHIDGTPWNGGLGSYLVASAYVTSLFQGDPVTLLNDGTIGIGVAGSPILGVFWGIKYKTATGAVQPGGLGGFLPPMWTASTTLATGTTGQAMVIDDPTVIFNMETSSSAGMTTTGLNLNYNFVSGTGNSSTGQSAYALDLASASANSNLNLKALRFAAFPGNVTGVGYNIVECVINNHILKGGSGTSGV